MIWSVPVDENGVIVLPDDLLEQTGWVEGDELEWIDRGDGSYQLRKLNHETNQNEKLCRQQG